jgi:hypothetical protein
MITEVYVEGKRLDADITSSLLTFAIDDIRDFSSRSTTWSKTIVLPGTANNNAIFGAIFDTGLTNDYDPTQPNIGYNFNASKSASCIIFQDNLQTFSGTLRILEIDIDQGRVEYQVALSGNLFSLSVALISKLLTDLDFSEYDTEYGAFFISNSWDNVGGSGVYFPLMDYGTYAISQKHHWHFGTFRPALYVREYLSKMFADAGFRFAAPLFDTERFKRMIVPHNQKDVMAPKTGTLFTAAKDSSDDLVLEWTTGTADGDVHFTNFLGGTFTTTDNETWDYAGASAITGTLIFTLVGRYSYGAFSAATTNISIRKTSGGSSADYYVDPVPLTGPTNGATQFFSRSHSISISFSPGDSFSVHFHGQTIIGVSLKHMIVNGGLMQFSTAATIMAPVEYGETIRMNYTLPKNIRQIDFLTSIVKAFNLYVYEDQFDDRLIHIRPFINFFEQGVDSVVDWSQKMDRNEVIKVKPMSELNSKLYQFSYAKDSDYYNDLYQKRYNEGYGSFTFDTEFEFSSNTTKVDVIFAPTPIVGYQGEDKVYSTIFKLNGTVEEKTDSVIRILQTRKITGVSSWKMLSVVDDTSATLGTYTEYGYAGHYDDPDNPSNDLNFGQLKEIFFQLVTASTLDRTQFNVFWSQYMAEVTSKDSKLLTARFYLTPKDIFGLRFSQFRVIDGVLFRLNKITDYNASQPDTCEVELLRVNNTNYKYPVGATSENDYALEWAPGQALLWHPIDGTHDEATAEILYKTF